MIFEMVNVGGVHPRLGDLVDRCCGWSYSIMKANACVAGYAAFKAAFPGDVYAKNASSPSEKSIDKRHYILIHPYN